MHDTRFWSILERKTYTHKAAQIVFNNNYDQRSNIKGIGNSIHDFWHLAQTVHFSISIVLYVAQVTNYQPVLQCKPAY